MKTMRLLLMCLLCSGCIDSAYDLSQLDTDDITIGDEQSVYRMPLATIEVKMQELVQNGNDISKIFEEVDIWLPTTLPNHAEFLDIERLLTQADYRNTLLEALVQEIAQSQSKRDQVGGYVWEHYSGQFIPLLFPLDGEPTKVQFMQVFNTAVSLGLVEQEIRFLANNYLTNIAIEDITYSIGKIDISQDVIEMLVSNLDPHGTVKAKNTLHLYGEVYSMLPVGICAKPHFTNTEITLQSDITPQQEVQLPYTQIFETDLRNIMAGVDMVIPVRLLTYYPKIGFKADQLIRIILRLQKCGGLKVEF